MLKRDNPFEAKCSETSNEAVSPGERTPYSGVSASPGDVATLYKEQISKLANGLRKMFGDGPPDPEDVSQQAFEKLIARKDRSDIKNLSAFLWRTARNIIISELRSRTAAESRDADYASSVFDPEGYLLTPERVLESKEQVSIAASVLSTMPDQRRKAFILVRVDGLSHGEAAEKLGISRPAVSKHVARATIDLHTAIMGETQK